MVCGNHTVYTAKSVIFPTICMMTLKHGKNVFRQPSLSFQLWYHKKTCIFLMIHGKFQSRKVFYLEDMEMCLIMVNYGDHN